MDGSHRKKILNVEKIALNPSLQDYHESSWAISLLKNQEFIDEIYWKYLSANPSAIELLTKNFDKIDWYELSCNKNESLWRNNEYVLK